MMGIVLRVVRLVLGEACLEILDLFLHLAKMQMARRNVR